MIIVANSSPLISLSSVKALPLVQALYRDIYVAEAVYREIVVAGAGKAGSSEVAAAHWIKRRTVASAGTVAQLMLTHKLERGECETLALAAEMSADLILLDEKPARKVAAQQGFALIGSLGVLLLAKSNGVMGEIRPTLDALLKAGMRLDPNLYAEILRRAGE
jgi:uncharacterized protein